MMFRLWCEWDCGQDDIVFTEKEKAKEFFNSNPMNKETFEDECKEEDREHFESPYAFFKSEGLVGLIELKVI